MRGDGFKEPPEGQKIRGSGDWVRDGMVWREEDLGNEEGREPIRDGLNAKPTTEDGTDMRNRRRNGGCSSETNDVEEQTNMGEQDSEVTGVPRRMQPGGEGPTATEQDAQEHGSEDEDNNGDKGGAEEEVGGKHLSTGMECPTVEELIWDDHENQAEDYGDDQDGAMEEGKDESEPSEACPCDEMAHAIMQDEGRKRKRRTWKMSEMREVTRAKMLERMEMSTDDITMQLIKKRMVEVVATM